MDYVGHWEVTYKKTMPPKYVLVRKKEYGTYKDIFIKSKYELAKECIHDGVSVVSNKERIKHKDAEEILKSKNSIYIKK